MSHYLLAIKWMKGIQLLLAVILVIRYDSVDSLNHEDSILVTITVIVTESSVEASEILMVTDDLPEESSGHSRSFILIANTRSVKGRFSNKRAVTFFYYSREFNWYAFNPVIFYFILVKHSFTFCTPFYPPNNNPGNLNILQKLSSNSIGMRQKEPINVKRRIFLALLKKPLDLKFCGSKSP